MILMIDNYDSFTYNLVQYLGQIGQKLEVIRNDKLKASDVRRMRPQAIVISPGPGSPEDAGVSVQVIREYGDSIPVLGVCLGHQAIGYAYGAKIIRAKNLMHGKTSLIHHRGAGCFKGVTDPFEATRYHSLLVDKKSLPKVLRVTAWTDDQEIMGLEHVSFPVFGVQFHPESIMTGSGMKILKNFLSLTQRGLRKKS